MYQVEFADNVECLNLLEGKPYGIFSLLQEQCQMGRNMDDAKLVDLFQSHLHKHPDFSTAKFSPSSFVVKHYAGDVSYNSDGFLEKNKDSLHDDLQVRARMHVRFTCLPCMISSRTIAWPVYRFAFRRC